MTQRSDRESRGSQVRATLVHSFALSLACLVSYWCTTRVLGRTVDVSKVNVALGAMWAVIATVFVYRTGASQSSRAALTRIAATLVSFALCLGYLLLLPFHVLGLAVLIGLSVLVATLIGRPEDAVTAAITTTVVLVVASLSPHDAWEQPILRLGDTAVGTLVGLAASRTGALLVRRLRQ